MGSDPKVRLTNINVLLDMAVDESKMTGTPVMEVVERIIRENGIELQPWQEETLKRLTEGT